MFFNTILGFTQSHFGPLGDIDGYIHLIQGTYKSDKPNKNTSIDKLHLKADCIDGSVVDVVREPIMYSFGLSSPAGLKKYKKPRINFLKKVNKSVSSHKTFYLEDDDRRPVSSGSVSRSDGGVGGVEDPMY